MKRVSPAAVERMLAALARIDALSKGIGVGNAWDDFTALAVELAGKPARPVVIAT